MPNRMHSGDDTPSTALTKPWKWTLLGIVSAVVVSASWAVYVLGFSILDVNNTRWLWGDLSLLHLAWVQFLSDHESVWMNSTKFSYPLALNVALFDPIPIFLLSAKMLHISPDINRQYVGMYFLACLMFQALFAYLAIDKAIQMSGVQRTRISTVSTTSMAIIAATLPFTFHRFQGHTALSSQWVLLMLIWASLCSLGATRIRWISIQVPVVFFSSGINPYIAAMGVINSLILGTAAINFIGWREHVARSTIILVVISTGFWLFGFIGAADIKAGGYGIYSMNLLGPLDSNGLSRFLTFDVPDPTNGQTWEGFNYLGFGLILFVCLSIFFAVKSLISHSFEIYERTKLLAGYFIAVILVFVLLSLSNKISIASHIFSIQYPEPILEIMGKFRASGRFFWMAGFLLIIGSTVLLAHHLSALGLAGIAFISMVVQLADIQPIGDFVRKSIHSASRLPPLQLTQRDISAIYVYPAWQCGPHETPGGIRNYESFGYTSAATGISINNFYAARNPQDQIEYHCDIDARLAQIEIKGLYILNNDIYMSRRAELQKTHLCLQTEFANDTTEQQMLLNGNTEPKAFWVCNPR